MEEQFIQLWKDAVEFIFFLLPIVVPIWLLLLLWKKFKEYTETRFLSTLTFTTLQIKLPQEVLKSPAAMELFLHSLFDTGREQTWYETIFRGRRRPGFSLEIAGDGHGVHFYIYTEVGLKHRVETQLYAQYPGIEVREVEDYTKQVEFDPEKNDMFAVEFKLTKPDPYPIKTYVDFGLADESEEELRIDPITPVVEFIGSIKPGEHAWYQVMIRSHRDIKGNPDDWKELAKKEIEGIRKASITKPEDIGDGVMAAVSNRTKGQDLIIAALERSVSKLGFDVGIRILYISPKGVFNKGHLGSYLGAFRHFGSDDLNGIKPNLKAGFDFPWQDVLGKKELAQKREFFQAYRDRAYFYSAYKKYHWWRPPTFEGRPNMVLNTEEIATIYHFPGQVSTTPGIGRAESRKAAPPPNLPI